MPFLPFFIVCLIFFITSETIAADRKKRKYKPTNSIVAVQSKPTKLATQRKVINRTAITELFINKRHEKTRDTMFTYCILMILLITSLRLIGIGYSSYNTFILILPIALLYIRNKIIDYRIDSGFYGYNEHEARELIEFIEANSDFFDDDSGTSHRVFSELELSKKSVQDWGVDEGLGRLT